MLFQTAHLAPSRRVGPQKTIAEAQRTKRQAPGALQTSISEMAELQAPTTDVQDGAVLDR